MHDPFKFDKLFTTEGMNLTICNAASLLKDVEIYIIHAKDISESQDMCQRSIKQHLVNGVYNSKDI